MLGKRSVGVVLMVRKSDPDWTRRSLLEAIASPVDALVQAALMEDKNGDLEGAVAPMLAPIEQIRQLTIADPFASAHRRVAAPVDRLSLLIERRRDYAGALRMIEEWKSTFAPVQPTAAVAETLRKRADRLQTKRG